MTFKQAVEDSPELEGAWCAGLQALRRADRKHVDAQDTERLTGSIDLDSALRSKSEHANEPVWDYGIGHQPRNRNEEIGVAQEMAAESSAAIA